LETIIKEMKNIYDKFYKKNKNISFEKINLKNIIINLKNIIINLKNNNFK